MRYYRQQNLALIFFGILWGGVAMGLVWIAYYSPLFPIRSFALEMTAPPPVSFDAVEKIGFWREGQLLKLSLSRIHQELLQIPWIKSVVLKRVWPDQVTIQIEPHQIRARWRDGRASAWVTKEGQFLRLESKIVPANLPILEGKAASLEDLWEMYQMANNMLSAIGHTVTAVRHVGETFWEIRLDTGIAIILGREAVKDQMAKLIMVLQQPFKSLVNRIAYIDTRYPAGFVVGWRS